MHNLFRNHLAGAANASRVIRVCLALEHMLVNNDFLLAKGKRHTRTRCILQRRQAFHFRVLLVSSRICASGKGRRRRCVPSGEALPELSPLDFRRNLEGLDIVHEVCRKSSGEFCVPLCADSTIDQSELLEALCRRCGGLSDRMASSQESVSS
jgi:hypothetical protein